MIKLPNFSAFFGSIFNCNSSSKNNISSSKDNKYPNSSTSDTKNERKSKKCSNYSTNDCYCGVLWKNYPVVLHFSSVANHQRIQQLVLTQITTKQLINRLLMLILVKLLLSKANAWDSSNLLLHIL